MKTTVGQPTGGSNPSCSVVKNSDVQKPNPADGRFNFTVGTTAVKQRRMLNAKCLSSVSDFVRYKKPGFTLVELLVVISIIALLLAILIPSLNKARLAAQSTVCRGHLKSAGQGLQIYAASFDNWLPGPSTSGSTLTRTNTVRAETSPVEPVQNTDWISPILGKELGLPGNTAKRLVAIFETALRCPANTLKFDYEYPRGGGMINFINVNEIKTASYSTAQGFHVYRRPAGVAANVEYDRPAAIIYDTYVERMVTVPSNYSPKLYKVGRACEKIFAMDGTRYIDVIDGQDRISFNSFACQLKGGNFMQYGPCTAQSGDPYLWEGTAPAIKPRGNRNKKYSYRHSGKMNAVFFDGHSSTLDMPESLNLGLYFPSGSIVGSSPQDIKSAQIYATGQILP